MISHLAKARVAVEVERFLVTDSLEDLNKKLDRYYMVLIVRSLHSDFDHLHDQVIVGDQIPSLDGLMTKVFLVPNLKKDDNQIELIESLQWQSLVEKEELVGLYEEDVVVEVGVLNAHIAREWVIPKNFVFASMVF